MALSDMEEASRSFSQKPPLEPPTTKTLPCKPVTRAKLKAASSCFSLTESLQLHHNLIFLNSRRVVGSYHCAESLSCTWCQWLEIISHHPCVEPLAQQALVSVRALYHFCSTTDEQRQGRYTYVQYRASKVKSCLSDFEVERTWIRGH